jgi:diadenosine tetraphosphate (Ap4A) HIT family hydrolase
MNPAFALHPRLQADTFAIGDMALSRALLMNDARFPWIILVPRLPDLCELSDLPDDMRSTMFDEIASASRALLNLAGFEKINVGALGNIVRQLHVHVVGRSSGDPAWPGPVWGFGVAQAYDSNRLEERAAALRSALKIEAPAIRLASAETRL